MIFLIDFRHCCKLSYTDYDRNRMELWLCFRADGFNTLEESNTIKIMQLLLQAVKKVREVNIKRT